MCLVGFVSRQRPVMFKNLKNIVVVSLSTVGSRVLGLVRDILIFAALGASAWNDAFILAFTLPNLFRRLLGEGALTSAMVPIFSDVLHRAGRSEAFAFLNQVLLRLLIILSALVVSGMVLFGSLVHSGMLSDRWALGAELAVVVAAVYDLHLPRGDCFGWPQSARTLRYCRQHTYTA